MSIRALSGLGPHTTPGPTTEIWGTTEVEGEGPEVVAVSVEKVGGSCLNAAMTTFNAACPSFISIDPGTLWSISLSDSLFESGVSYKFTAKASGLDDAEKTSDDVVWAWDNTAPGAVGSASLIEYEEELGLNWTAATGADHYLVIAKQDTAVSFYPTAGATYTTGDTLPGSHYVAYVGTSLGFDDQNLAAFKMFYYAIYAVDAAGNIGTESLVNGITGEIQKFTGATYVAAISAKRHIRVEWQPYGDSNYSDAVRTYEVYTATTTGAQNYASAPQASIVGGHGLTYRDLGTSDGLYFVVRQRTPDNVLGPVTKEFYLNLSKGVSHKVGFNSRQHASVAGDAFFRQTREIKTDPWGNLIFSSEPGLLQVFCHENTNAPYCRSRTVQSLYSLAGRDGSFTGGTGDNFITNNRMGDIYSVAVDNDGNVYAGDITNFVVWAFCFNPKTIGVCRAQPARSAIRIVGTGASADGANNIAASGSGIGAPYGLSVDSYNNLYIGDFTYPRVRLACFGTLSGFCAGKTKNNIYQFVGTGVNLDGADNAVASSAYGIGAPGNLFMDSSNNLFIADTTRYRIRAVCAANGSSAGYCNGKTVGNAYRLNGTGVAANGGDDVLASSAGIGLAYGVATDSYGNIYFSDNSYFYIRVICLSASGTSFCAGKTVGNTYIVAGTGVSTDGANGVAVANSIGRPNGLAIDANNNLYTADNLNMRIRAVCQSVTAAGFCNGKIQNYHYRLAGVGATNIGQEYRLALQEPLGLTRAVTQDANGNVYFADQNAMRIMAICFDTASAGFCFNKTTGYVYVVAGIGSAADGTNGAAIARGMGLVYGIATDSNGNLFFTDITYFRIRAVCFNVAAAGFCNGKTAGNSYRLAGTGVTGAGGTAVDPSVTTMGAAWGIAVDTLGNIFYADNTNRRVRAICFNVAGGGFCNGLTTNRLYNFAGAGGAATDGANGVAVSTNYGALSSIAVDALNNVYFGDATYYRVRVACYNTSAGYCTGLTIGNAYRVTGTGALANGVDNAAAVGTGHGIPVGLAVDSSGNIYFADDNFCFIRAVCLNVASDTQCQGKSTAGNVYRLYGAGVDGAGVSNVTGSSTSLGNNGYGGLSITTDGNLYFTDDYNAIRIFLN